MKKYNWVNYPENIPSVSGYYMCVYFNLEQKCDLFKAIYWNKKWIQWNPKIQIENQVKSFLPDSMAKYYTTCLFWWKDNYDNGLVEKYKDD